MNHQQMTLIGCEGGDLPRADIWTAGFPCQDISVAGKQVGFRGHRSSLFFQVTRLIREMPEEDRPSYLIFENVKNFFSVNRGYDFLSALIELDEIGYDVEWQLLNSRYHRVPQNRERVFLIGHLRGRSTRKVFPITENVATSCMGQETAKTPVVRTLTAGGHSGGLHSGMTIIKEPEINILAHRKNFRRNCQIFDSTGITEAIDTGQGGGRTISTYHKGRYRRLTPREYMRLQGVQEYIIDKLLLSGISDTQLYRAAGDAWTVNVGYEIAKRLE